MSSFKLDFDTFSSLCVSTHSTVDQTSCVSIGWEVVVTCEMLKPFYCNDFKLWELAARCDCSAVFVGGR